MHNHPHASGSRCRNIFVMGIIALALALLSPQAAAARAALEDTPTRSEGHFLRLEDVADSMRLLPAPPEPDSVEFQLDEAMYRQGISLRNTPAGDRAAQDASNSPEQNAMSFSDALGLSMGPDTTPAIFALARKVMHDAGRLATYAAKRGYGRTRPFALHGEATCKPAAQVTVNPNRSYPSGHSSQGWALALVLAEINPARQVEILQRGLDLGQGRVICGYHWQSDVHAGRIVGAAIVARLHANEAFVRELAAAKEEFARLSRAQKPMD